MLQIKLIWVAGLLAAVLAPTAFARESVCLNTGFCLNADSHTVEGDLYVLHTGNGTVQVSSSQIAEITVLPDFPKDPPVAARSAKLSTSVYSAAAFEEMLVEAAIKQGLEPEFVRSVARIESNLRQDAVSNKGAIGLMQLMPGHGCGIGRRRSRCGR